MMQMEMQMPGEASSSQAPDDGPRRRVGEIQMVPITVSDSDSDSDLDPLNLEVPVPLVRRTVDQVLTEPRYPQTQVGSCCNICIPICVLGASIALLLLGFNIAVMTEAMAKRIPEDLLEYQTLVLYLISLVGTILAGCATDKWGRVYPIMLTGIIFGLGSLLMGAFRNNAGLVVGRVIIQIGAGFGPTATTLYVSEVSPPACRGFFTSMPEVLLNLGTFLGFHFHYVYSKLHPDYGQSVVLVSAVVWPVTLVIVYRILPESPRWLIMRGHLGDALRVLEEKICSSREEAHLQLEEMKQSVGIPPERTEAFVEVPLQQRVWSDLGHPSPELCHIMLCTWVIQAFQQLCGVDTLFIYRSRFFEKIVLTSANKQQLMTANLQLVKTVVMLLPALLMDVVGRRNMLLGSLGGTALSLASLGVGVFGVDDKVDTRKPKWAKGTITVSLYLCFTAYSAGMGSIPSVYAAEVFPIRLRTSGYVISVAANQAMGLLISACFLGLKLGGAVLILMVLSILGCVFVYLCMPDTRGRTLERTRAAFGSAMSWRNLQTEVQMEAVGAPATVASSL